MMQKAFFLWNLISEFLKVHLAFKLLERMVVFENLERFRWRGWQHSSAAEDSGDCSIQKWLFLIAQYTEVSKIFF